MTTQVDGISRRCALGIDAGGTQTRWALASTANEIIAAGHVGGMTALQINSAAGYEQLRSTLRNLADAVRVHGAPRRVCAGVPGTDGSTTELAAMMASALGISSQSVTVRSDIEIAYLDLFAPGEGYVVYAGTGSIAAFIDKDGELHRAGGRGVMLDDAGGGFWIAREALRYIWRQEDERPGSWRDSPMAVEMFARIGGSDWTHSRQFFYGSERGDIGKLALAVALKADADPVAHSIISAAGHELARLAHALTHRYGERPIALSGRAAALHPLIEQTMRAALHATAPLQLRVSEPHLAAARIAAKAMEKN
jgi:N-acetylglucosamine kinase-like BadF-type ATPase